MNAVQPTLFPEVYQDQLLEGRPAVDPRDFRPCLVCNRLLKVPASIERGMGPTCAGAMSRNQRAKGDHQ